jgi:predicted ABC-type ATPase
MFLPTTSDDDLLEALSNLLDDYAPLADRWALWDNSAPPAKALANSATHSIVDLRNFFTAQ